MYNNYKGSKTLIAYNFLGPYVTTLPHYILEDYIDEMCLNDLLTEISEEATEDHLTIDDTVKLIYEEFEDAIDDYNEDFEDEQYALSPVLEDILIVDVHSMDYNGNVTYDAYKTKYEITESSLIGVNSIIARLNADEIMNTTLIVLFIDIVIFGLPLCQIIL